MRGDKVGFNIAWRQHLLDYVPGNSTAIVGDTDYREASVFRAGDLYLPTAFPIGKAVDDRILHERLEHERRDMEAEDLVGQIHLDPIQVGKANINQRPVELNSRYFVCHLIGLPVSPDIVPEQLCQSAHEVRRAVCILHHRQLDACVQRVEQKVRIHLGTQALHFSGPKQCLHSQVTEPLFRQGLLQLRGGL
jgi:hypothetical protein